MLALLIADLMALKASPEVMAIVAVAVPTVSSRLPAEALGAPAVERSTVPVAAPAVENGSDCACCTVDSACCKKAGDALQAVGGGVDRLQALADLIEQRA